MGEVLTVSPASSAPKGGAGLSVSLDISTSSTTSVFTSPQNIQDRYWVLVDRLTHH
jgi:hypothetical protein